MPGPLSPNTGADREVCGNRSGLRHNVLLVYGRTTARARHSPRGQARPGRIRDIVQQCPEAGRRTREDNVHTLAYRRELYPPGFVVQAVGRGASGDGA